MNSSNPSRSKTPGQVVLLRVAIDKGAGGIYGPLLNNDGRFEYIPIDADFDHPNRTYGNTDGVWGGKLIDYFPDGRKKGMRDWCIHFDPEFKTFTYGDPTFPKQSLGRLRKGDLLVLYAGLKGWGKCTKLPGLYIIGYFVVEVAGFYPDLKWSLRPFKKNWHVIHDDTKGKWSKNKRRKTELVLVKGGPGSRLLEKAVLISGSAKGKDQGGHPVFVLDPKLTKVFGNFTKLNAIQRSTPRWVKELYFRKKASAFVRGLR